MTPWDNGSRRRRAVLRMQALVLALGLAAMALGLSAVFAARPAGGSELSPAAPGVAAALARGTAAR